MQSGRIGIEVRIGSPSRGLASTVDLSFFFLRSQIQAVTPEPVESWPASVDFGAQITELFIRRKLPTTTKKQNAIYSYWDPQVRIQTLHRQEEGVLALIVFKDNKWLGDQAILATMEVDLTRGYDQWRNGEANLLITTGLVGRLSNTPNLGFAYEIQGVVDYLASHSVNALPGRRYPTTPLLGLDWVIRPTQVCIPMQPMEVNSRNLIDGRVSISFSNYTTARDCTLEDEEERELIAVLTTTKISYEEDYAIPTEKHPAINVNIDYEEDPNQIIASSEEFPFILVHRLSSALEPSSLQLAIYPLLATYSTADNLAFPRHPLSRAALLLIFISVALGYMKLEAWFLSFCSVCNSKKGRSEIFHVLVWINAACIVPNLFFPLKGIRNSLRKILKDLGELDYDPNVITYTTVMKCYFRHGKFEQRFQMFDGMIEKGYTTDVFAYCAAISALVKRVWINAARIVPNLFFPLKEIQNSLRKILKDLGESDYDPNVITYTTVMKCCFRHGKCEQGFHIFDGMIEKAVQQMFLHIVQQ
ncbi:hypothetical protein ZIOFF_014834 [Zingiber officinale]|uniref:Pentatricopeptide repeat-containing protein n=1 Tax=Zingiber officinale TaxID=94328 RepID=A0A8J5HQI3_ZINOF|nr:hypothetical protein ZIOFF_014834 [Zingiber officinale]